MGCDIHAFVEVRRYPHGDEFRERGVWVSVDKWSVDEGYELYPNERIKKYFVDYCDAVYSGRDYGLFAVLADVRNNFGIEPISEPKGFPDDASVEVKEENDFWFDDTHSHSYLTLEELSNYNLNEKVNPIDVTLNKGIFEDTIDSFEQLKESLRVFLDDKRSPYYQVNEDDIRIVFWFDN